MDDQEKIIHLTSSHMFLLKFSKTMIVTQMLIIMGLMVWLSSEVLATHMLNLVLYTSTSQ